MYRKKSQDGGSKRKRCNDGHQKLAKGKSVTKANVKKGKKQKESKQSEGFAGRAIRRVSEIFAWPFKKKEDSKTEEHAPVRRASTSIIPSCQTDIPASTSREKPPLRRASTPLPEETIFFLDEEEEHFTSAGRESPRPTTSRIFTSGSISPMIGDSMLSELPMTPGVRPWVRMQNEVDGSGIVDMSFFTRFGHGGKEKDVRTIRGKPMSIKTGRIIENDDNMSIEYDVTDVRTIKGKPMSIKSGRIIDQDLVESLSIPDDFPEEREYKSISSGSISGLEDRMKVPNACWISRENASKRRWTPTRNQAGPVDSQKRFKEDEDNVLCKAGPSHARSRSPPCRLTPSRASNKKQRSKMVRAPSFDSEDSFLLHEKECAASPTSWAEKSRSRSPDSKKRQVKKQRF